MQSCKPAEGLLQRLLQSERIRNCYRLQLEVENDCTKIFLRYLENGTLQPESPVKGPVLQRHEIFGKPKDFFVGN